MHLFVLIKVCNSKQAFVKPAVRRKCEYILHLNVRLLKWQSSEMILCVPPEARPKFLGNWNYNSSLKFILNFRAKCTPLWTALKSIDLFYSKKKKFPKGLNLLTHLLNIYWTLVLYNLEEWVQRSQYSITSSAHISKVWSYIQLKPCHFPMMKRVLWQQRFECSIPDHGYIFHRCTQRD